MTAREVRPPDLEMQVRIAYEQGRTRLIYTLDSPTGAVPFSHREVEGPSFEGSPEQFQRHLVRKLEQLGDRRDVDGELLLHEDIERKLCNLGRELWRALMPLEIRSAYRQIREKVRSWLIVSQEPWIPWELLRPFELDSGGDPLDEDFLSLTFELTRWLSGKRTPAPQILVRRFAVLATATDLRQAEREREILLEIAPSTPRMEDATPKKLSVSHLVAFLESSKVDLIHFAGHGSLSLDRPDESGIPFPDGSVLRPEDLGGPLAAHLAGLRPLVFLNACWAGQQGWSLTRLGGWAARWVQVCGCGAFIAPLWPARDKAAHAFAQAFYQALSQNKTLGEAALKARRDVARRRRGDPTALAYAVYGHPNARVFLGGLDTRTESPEMSVPVAACPAPEPQPREHAALVWLRRQWQRPGLRKRWAAAMLGSTLAVVMATGGRWAAVTNWLENRSQDVAPAARQAAKADPPPPVDSSRGEPQSARSGGAKDEGAAPEEVSASIASHGNHWEISATTSLRPALTSALDEAAAPLADIGIAGWTIRVDLEEPRMSTFTQDGLPRESCRLLAYCRARRDRRSLHLGSVMAVNAQGEGTIACKAAVGDLAKSVVQRLVTTLGKEDA